MDNELLHIGDEILVNVNIQASGIVTLTNFIENITGITTQRYVEKWYRATINDVLWDDWKELNLNNLSSKTYHLFDNFLHIQIRYVRSGSDDTGIITFNNINFSGNWQSNTFQAPTLMNSIFSSLVGTNELMIVEKNLFKKLYFRGVVPEYIERGKNRNYDEDEDYIALTSTIAKFFAIMICFNKRFENIFNDEELLLEYIKQWGIFVNDSDININDLQNIVIQYYQQIHDRGTEMIFKRNGYLLPNGENVKVDGEFLRLFRNSECDELLYENIEHHRLGLCIGQSSPLYRGTGYSKQLNKIYKDGEEFIDWNYYGFDERYATHNFDGNKVNIDIANMPIGYFHFGTNSDGLIVCDCNLDYEISFEFLQIGQNSYNTGNDGLTVRIYGFDKNKNILNDAFCKTDESVIKNSFGTRRWWFYEENVWYKCRLILRSYQSISLIEENVENGHLPGNPNLDLNLYNLKFNNILTKFLRLEIYFVGQNNNHFEMRNISIRPAVRGKNILPSKNDGRVDAVSLGFIQSPDIFHTYARSNNNNIKSNELINTVEKYLYPFNNTNLFTVISKYE